MPKVGQANHESSVVTSVAGVGAVFNIANVHQHELHRETEFPVGSRFQGVIDTIIIKVTNIAGGATSLTVRACFDAAGDFTFLPDTTATIATGVTTATSGCIAIKYEGPIRNIITNNDKVYLFVKTNAGTVTLAQSLVTWEE